VLHRGAGDIISISRPALLLAAHKSRMLESSIVAGRTTLGTNRVHPGFFDKRVTRDDGTDRLIAQELQELGKGACL